MFSDVQAAQLDLAVKRVVESKLMSGYPDGMFKPIKQVNEADFKQVLDRLSTVCLVTPGADFSVKDDSQAISRVRAVATLVKYLTDPLAVDLIQDTDTYLSAFEDAGQIPQWARKQIAAAVDGGFISATGAFRPNDPLSRGELATILSKCLPVVAGTSEQTASTQTPPTSTAASEYSGLVIYALGLGLNRSMSPVIESEDGRAVYPDKQYLPSIQYIEDHGIASFVNDAAKSPRAGSNPLTLKAVAVKGYAKQVAVVSNEDAARILAAAQSSDFIKTWKVTFVIDKGL